MKKRVVVAMSGGVDSSTAAYLLKKKGLEVIGITLNLGLEKDKLESQCCSVSTAREAKLVSDFLKIPHYTLDFRQEFEKEIVNYFVKEYARGRTPNPCVRCNQFIKFGLLFKYAKKLEADFLATGHYARIENEPKQGWVLKRAKDKKKDQSYFLYRLKREILPHLLFPLGKLRKEEVREIASKAGLPVSSKKESQEICFLPSGGFKYLFEKLLPEALEPGPIYNHKGEIIGKHLGLAFYTIGQRKKIGVASSDPLYVYRIDRSKKAIFVGPKEKLYQIELKAVEANWLVEVSQTILEGEVKIRSTTPAFPATIYKENGSFKAVFKQSQLAISPGQSAVIYQKEVVLGGGVIAQ